MGKRLDFCGNKTGQNLLVTEDQVEMIFHSDGKIEQRGYLLNFTLVSLPSVSNGKWDHKEADEHRRLGNFLPEMGGGEGAVSHLPKKVYSSCPNVYETKSKRHEVH